jgi:hypothetical protein
MKARDQKEEGLAEAFHNSRTGTSRARLPAVVAVGGGKSGSLASL